MLYFQNVSLNVHIILEMHFVVFSTNGISFHKKKHVEKTLKHIIQRIENIKKLRHE